MLRFARGMHITRRTRQDGMTLLEIMVALAVVGVAVTGLVTMFTASRTLGEMSRSTTVALSLAQDQLAAIQVAPQDFAWPSTDDLAASADAPVELKAGDGAQTFAPPVTMPIGSFKKDREAKHYARYAWQAWVSQPSVEAQHLELTVVVSWDYQGKQRAVTVSTLVPRRLKEDAA